MLQDIYNSYVKLAMCIPGFELSPKVRNADITQLANGYCDADEAGDEDLRSKYFAALMVRYWFKIYDYDKSSKSSRLEIEDYTSWLYEALELAFSNRRWRDPNNKLYTDKNGPDKVINMCCSTVRLRHYYTYNLDKNKINYLTDSIDRQVELYGDAAEAAQITSGSSNSSAIDTIISMLVKDNKILEAIIVDGICYQDTFKEFKTKYNYKDEETGEEDVTYRYSHEFNQHMLINHLKALVQDDEEVRSIFLNYFGNSYGIEKDQYEDALTIIESSNNQKLYTYIRKTLYELKNSKEIKNILCI